MKTVTGRLLIDLLQNGTVQMTFAPNGADGNARPILSKNVHYAQSDLTSLFEIAAANAEAQIARLQQDRHVDLVVAIDGAKVPSLFQAR